MNNIERSMLEEAYMNTNYVVQHEPNQLVIRIGETNSELDKLLKNHGSGTWTFLTAYNPFSKSLTNEENKTRQENLIKELESQNFYFLIGYGQGEGGDWPAEPSVFIFDVDREAAILLGKKYGQNAIVVGQLGNAAELVWC